MVAFHYGNSGSIGGLAPAVSRDSRVDGKESRAIYSMVRRAHHDRGRESDREFRRCLVEIKTDLQHYHEVMAQLPNVEEFTDQDIERRSAKVFQLFEVAWEVNTLKADLSRKFEKLHLLLK